jgi:hypothetical protein
MNLVDPRPESHDGFSPLIEVDMEAEVFGADWAHCDNLSSYVARMVSHNRADSLLYSNLFSSALNELLETAFRAHASDGTFRCRIWRSGRTDRVELVIPCRAEQQVFYLDTVALAHHGDAAERYHGMLFSDRSFDTRTGLLELAVDYAAAITVEPEGDHAVRLTTDLVLEPENS